ncbi:DUF115 domain-containing protein [Alteromonas sp. ASW11-19]|uniref:DUF115 domain-containing protein n=1 Tax=Alteromonas salexigens TaxID=2982530 RepID=A0ABT2VPJ5_9ALTE|nr:6-hydroxymethylpterin diphosphokinase MptE-like protein [Alteromonas salexigens]MCU7554994.1 DUF115 domain-containing protein [Alteromonas salexigens]
MLKNIKLHVHNDESVQSRLEAELALTMQRHLKENIQAFKVSIPSLVSYIETAGSQNISLFCNKNGEPNIVDYGLGRVLYGLNPKREIVKQLDHFLSNSMRVDMHGEQEPVPKISVSGPNLATYQQYQRYNVCPAQVDVLVVLGIGLAEHIKLLLTERKIKNLVIYEPEVQYFSCSAMVGPWKDILSLARENGTAIFVQLNKDGRDLVSDMNELNGHVSFDNFFVYQHYNNPVFTSICHDLRTRSWRAISKDGLRIKTTYTKADFEPRWLQPVDLSEAALSDQSENKFQANLAAFKRYFPDIYEQFSSYTPDNWHAVKVARDEYNLLNATSLNTWYGESPKAESELAFTAYASHPNRDGLVLGYNGTKLRHYLHYKFVLECDSLLDDISERQGALPDTIKSLIMFGMGTGYQLQTLLERHDVEKLFLCEPNKDFFYASLFAIDWAGILAKIDDSGFRIYINIGDDGTNLFRDLLNQFYAIGPYNLAHTYFYQAYYNAELNSAISQLREQLQIVISMGEYFDHAYYGINHTVEGIARNYRHLISNPHTLFTGEQKECPVFIVGNGPSLDYSLETIKAHQHEAIVISCGTALQVLHRNGIVPDYHAEIEQNRSTYDWAIRLGDAEYLKQVTLLSCNGIHPDTCDLYKAVFIGFKDGESSTVSNMNVLGEERFSVLRNAFPTVSNFALNLVTLMGFKQIYLFGVDLGFIDKKHHHSKASGYYDSNGQPLYDYEEKNNTGLVVPGNFAKVVSTKHEFKISRVFMEELLNTYSGDCYNTSNGAKIKGTQPLAIDNILILSSGELKQQVKEAIGKHAFISCEQPNYKKTFAEHYRTEVVREQLQVIEQQIDATIKGDKKVEWLIEFIKNAMFTAYKQQRSLLFYYLYGTMNFANAFLLKVTAADNNENALTDALSIVKKRFSQFAVKINSDDFSFDITSSFCGLREREFLRNLSLNSPPLIKVGRHVRGLTTIVNMDYATWFESEPEPTQCSLADCDIILSDDHHVLERINVVDSSGPRLLSLTDQSCEWQPQQQRNTSYVCTVSLPDFDTDEEGILAGRLPVMNNKMFEILVKKCFLLIENAVWFIPRYGFVDGSREHALAWLNSMVHHFTSVDEFLVFPGYIAIPRDKSSVVLTDALGNRGEWVNEKLNAEYLIAETVTKKEFLRLKQTFHVPLTSRSE